MGNDQVNQGFLHLEKRECAIKSFVGQGVVSGIECLPSFNVVTREPLKLRGHAFKISKKVVIFHVMLKLSSEILMPRVCGQVAKFTEEKSGEGQ